MKNKPRPLPGLEPASIKTVTTPTSEVGAVITGPVRPNPENLSTDDSSSEDEDTETPDVSKHVHGILEAPSLPFEEED